MGLAAVPFGTAQAMNYEIKVTQEHKPDAEHFKISVKITGAKPSIAEIVWPHDKELPNPIYENKNMLWKYYGGRLAREMDVCAGEDYCSKEEFRAHVLEWLNFYCSDDVSKISKADKALENFFRKRYGTDIGSFEKLQGMLKSGEKGGEAIVRDAIKKHMEEHRIKGYCQELYGPCRDFIRAADFCKGCFYECYELWATFGVKVAWLYLVKDAAHRISKSTYTLVVIPAFHPRVADATWHVISDIPTVFLGNAKRYQTEVYCATNEIVDMEVRRCFAKLYTIVKAGKVCSNVAIPAKSFIRIRRHANELPFKKDIVTTKNAVDITCGSVTDAWIEGRHMNTQFCSYITGRNVFGNPLEAVSHVERFLNEMDSKKELRRRLRIKRRERVFFFNGEMYSCIDARDLSDFFTSAY